MRAMSMKGVNTVASDDSGKLVKHLDDAKDWLDKAKQEYTQANPIRGELILNLAQAEIKYAWELSHVRFVSQNNDQDSLGEGKPGEGKPRVRNFQARVALPIAAAVLVILAASLLWFEGRNSGLTPQIVAVNEKTMPTIEPSGVLFQPTVIAPQIGGRQADEKQRVVVGSESAATSTAGQALAEQKLGGESNPESKSKSIAQVPLPTIPSESPAGATTESSRLTENRKDLAYGNNQTNLQPVSQIAIDVDALTKEANHSLRNGK